MSVMRASNGLIYDRPAYVVLPDGQQYKISFNREPVAGETIYLGRVRYIVTGVEWIEEMGLDPGSLSDTGVFSARISLDLDQAWVDQDH